jgi:hypothetical protein
MDRRIDVLVAACFSVLGFFMILAASEIKSGMMRDPIGPRAAFYVCGGVLALGGLAVIIGHLRRWSKQQGHIVPSEGGDDEAGYPASAGRAWALILAVLGLATLWNPLGFLIAMPLFLIAALWIMGGREVWSIMMIALLFTGIVYLIFAQALGVRIPVGPLTPLFRSLGWINL